MSSLGKLFGTDSSAEVTGTWVDYGDFKLLIARAGGENKAFTKALEEALKPHRRGIQTGAVTNDMLISFQRPVYAKHVLLNWEGVTGEDGKPLDCTVENVMEQFVTYPDFFLEVQEMAGSLSNFRDKEDEDDSKNSKKS